MHRLAPPGVLLLAVLAACGGDRAGGRSADTTVTVATGTAASSGSVALGGDTALAPAGGAGAPASSVGGAPATASASGTVPSGRPAPLDPAATATATGTAVPDGTATSTAPTPDAAGGAPPSGALAPATPAPAQPAPEPAPTRAGRAAVPFAPTERVEYDVRFGALDVGDAAMQVNGIEDVRGHETYHVVFRVSGGTLFFKVNDRYESWIDTRSISSHRFKQQIDEGSYERERTFEIFQERGVYREDRKPEQKTVAQPLDDGSFFYFVRTIPLEVGKTYTFERYFRPDRNPVTIRVLRKERVKVPAGTFDATVIQPLIKTKGIFGEGGRAEIWLADDSTRAMLQMKSDLKFGSLNLYMKRYRAGTRPQ